MSETVASLHPCCLIYKAGANGKIYGETQGVCRITGMESKGLPFWKWVKDTFTDHAYLKPGTIISNEALFCFEEQSTFLSEMLGREKPQRFRTYSHIIDRDGVWHCCTKADKRKIYDLITQGATLVCLSDSGQKHLLFKHRSGMWQLEDSFVTADVPHFIRLHRGMCNLLAAGFSQTEVISGNYLQYRIMQISIPIWRELEDKIKTERGTAFFNFVSWLLFTDKQS